MRRISLLFLTACLVFAGCSWNAGPISKNPSVALGEYKMIYPEYAEESFSPSAIRFLEREEEFYIIHHGVNEERLSVIQVQSFTGDLLSPYFECMVPDELVLGEVSYHDGLFYAEGGEYVFNKEANTSLSTGEDYLVCFGPEEGLLWTAKTNRWVSIIETAPDSPFLYIEKEGEKDARTSFIRSADGEGNISTLFAIPGFVQYGMEFRDGYILVIGDPWDWEPAFVTYYSKEWEVLWQAEYPDEKIHTVCEFQGRVCVVVKSDNGRLEFLDGETGELVQEHTLPKFGDDPKWSRPHNTGNALYFECVDSKYVYRTFKLFRGIYCYSPEAKPILYDFSQYYLRGSALLGDKVYVIADDPVSGGGRFYEIDTNDILPK